MPTSIRLDPEAERLLRRLAKQRGQTKSEVVRAAIQSLAKEMQAEATDRASAYDRLAHVIGIADSGGRGALSENTGAKLRALLAERRRDRGSR